MIHRLFPTQIDNKFRGHWLGFVIFVLVIIAKGGQAIQTIVHTRATATGPDGISLTGLNDSQVDEVLSLFAVLGVYGLILPAISVVVLLRWRALVPFMYLCYIVFFFANRLLHYLHPNFAHEKVAFGLYINLAILTVTVIGLLLSLKPNSGAVSEA